MITRVVDFCAEESFKEGSESGGRCLRSSIPGSTGSRFEGNVLLGSFPPACDAKKIDSGEKRKSNNVGDESRKRFVSSSEYEVPKDVEFASKLVDGWEGMELRGMLLGCIFKWLMPDYRDGHEP